MKKVKFTNLYKLLKNKSQIIKKINFLIKHSKFIGGDEVKNFEKKFAKFTKSKYCITVANGTDALEIALNSLKLKKGSEVILPANTWISTAESIMTNGLKPIFCDINLDDYSICLKDLKKKISKRTKAIIAVHLYGNPTNIFEIKKIIKNKNIKIVEDCAQAHGTSLGKKHVGTFGDVGTFSFFPGKNLGGFGDGGAIVTKNRRIWDFCLRARNHGALKKYDHKFSGRNSRLDTINAAVLNIKLKSYLQVIKKRNELSKIYFQKFKVIDDIKSFKLDKKNTHSFHQFVIRTKYRNKLATYLKMNNIQTMVHYPYMLNELKFFNKMKLRNAKNLGKKILSLPISEEHSKNEILYVAEKVQKFFKMLRK
tara:strand:- start:1066 stop:2166 length:1101 start_codon:yes stop_codon:yes gene_type:complete